MSPLSKRELGAARGAAVDAFVLHPVVGGAAPRFVGHAPAVDPALGVTNKHALVVFGNSKCCYRSGVFVVLAFKRRMHRQFTAENQLLLPTESAAQAPLWQAGVAGLVPQPGLFDVVLRYEAEILKR